MVFGVVRVSQVGIVLFLLFIVDCQTQSVLLRGSRNFIVFTLFIFVFIYFSFILGRVGKGREVLHTHLPCSPGYICNICQIGCFWSCGCQSVRPTQSREVLRTHLARISCQGGEYW